MRVRQRETGLIFPLALPVHGLGLAVGETHRRYTNFINARGRWTGYLFQSRFASVAMDEAHLMAAVCYVSLNPVRARLVAR
jgi:putative transposase